MDSKYVHVLPITSACMNMLSIKMAK